MHCYFTIMKIIRINRTDRALVPSHCLRSPIVQAAHFHIRLIIMAHYVTPALTLVVVILLSALTAKETVTVTVTEILLARVLLELQRLLSGAACMSR